MPTKPEMDFKKAKAEFLVRYYWWSLEEIRREVSAGFPFLKSFKSGVPQRFLSMMQSASQIEAVRLLIALNKRRMKTAVESLGEHLTDEEASLCGEFFRMVGPTPDELHRTEQQLVDGMEASINRIQFANSIREQLDPVFRGKLRKAGKYSWKYEAVSEGWIINTWVDTGGKHHQLDYSHSIGTSGHRFLHENINVLSWLGLSGSTQWYDLTENETREASTSLTRFCMHFMEAVPKLLKGLSLEPPG